MERARGRLALLSRIRIVERTGSTNADLLAHVSAVEGDWLVALTQDAGRGRQGRQWIGEAGNFFGSTLVNLRPLDPPAASLSLTAGLALIEAVDAAVPKLPLLLKWPNDLLLSGGKLAGILLERSGDRIVIGVGVNLATAPKVESRSTASLGGVIAPQAFAPLLAASMSRCVSLWRAHGSAALAQAWMVRAHPLGTAIRVHSGPDEVVDGLFAGVEADGALRINTPRGLQVLRAGDVSLA